MTDEKITKANECNNATKSEKIKAIYPHIVVSGNIDNIYYSIQWYDIDKKSMQDGYGSYTLENVRKWLKEDFEVVDDDIDNLINRLESENERLQGEIGKLNKAYPCTIQMGDYCLMYARSLDDYDKLIGDISVEAIKKFKQAVKTLFRLTFLRRKCYDKIFDEAEAMLLKEMVGEGG